MAPLHVLTLGTGNSEQCETEVLLRRLGQAPNLALRHHSTHTFFGNDAQFGVRTAFLILVAGNSA